MVSFDRRYRSVRKGYSRESVKRDTEVVLEQDLSGRRFRDSLDDDTTISNLIFRPSEDRYVAEEPVEPVAVARGESRHVGVAAEPLEVEVEPIEFATEPLQVTPAQPREGLVRRWLRKLFG